MVGIRLAPGRIDVAEALRLPGARPQLLRCASFERPDEDRDGLLRLRKSLRLDRARCTTLMRAGGYQLFLLEAPVVPAQELRQAMRWRVKDLIDFPVEAATVEVIDIPGDERALARSRWVLAVVARTSIVADYVQPFLAAGIALEAVDVTELAQRNVAALFEEDGRGVALLAFDESGGLLTVTRDGELYVARRIELALGDARRLPDGERTALLERVVLELQRSIDHCERQFSYVPLARLVLALPFDVPGLAEALHENLGLPVEPMDLAQRIDLAAVPELRAPVRQAQMLATIGAALREEQPVAA